MTLNYWQDKEDLQMSLELEGKRLQTAFDVAHEMTLTNMSQLATFVANDPRCVTVLLLLLRQWIWKVVVWEGIIKSFGIVYRFELL